MRINVRYWGLFLVFHVVLSSACEKIDTPTEIDMGNEESPDSVYVSQSKIYADTLYSGDSIVTILLKFDNPVLRENIADPSIIRGENGIFYLYSTESSKFPNVPVFKSKDLINWYFVNTAFTDKTRPSSFAGNIWAPDINLINGKYVLFYSMSRWGGEWECGLGVATSDRPYGPFSDHAKLFDSREIDVQNSIDPFYLEDNGYKYLFWGSHHGIFGIRLSDDGLSLAKGAEKFQIAGKGGEGTYIHKKDGYYYLFVSVGSCCEGLSSTYKVLMGRSQSLEGPYYDQQGKLMMEDNAGTVFLQSNSFVAGPGHNSEFITDKKGDNWVLYHGYLRQNPELNRVLFLDKVYWDNGWPHIPDRSPSQSSIIPCFEENQNEPSLLQKINQTIKSFLQQWHHSKS